MDYHTGKKKRSLWGKLKRFLNARGSRHTCCVCGNHFFAFSPFRGGWKSFSPYLHDVQWISSDFDHFWCPACQSHDRERHILLYFDQLHLWDTFKGASVLHLAPEKYLSQKIQSCLPARYVRGDLFPTHDDMEKIDVTAIPYPDNTFDWVLCNHVLEHVPDDSLALKEIFRVLRPGGHALLQTPFADALSTTRENEPEILASEDLKIAFYGQEDHIRLYGRDLFDRIRHAGFALTLQRHADLLPEKDALKYCVNPLEPLFLCTKPKQS